MARLIKYAIYICFCIIVIASQKVANFYLPEWGDYIIAGLIVIVICIVIIVKRIRQSV